MLATFTPITTLAVAAGVTVPLVMYFNKNKSTITIKGADYDKKASKIEVNKESTIVLKAKSGQKIKSIKKLTIDGKELKEGQDYTFDLPTNKITIKAEAMTSTKIEIEVESEPITPTVKTLTGITLSGTYKTEYTAGETLNLEGLVVTAHYTDAPDQPVTNYTTTPSTTKKLTKEDTQVTVSYTEGDVTKTESYNITVTDPTPVVQVPVAYDSNTFGWAKIAQTTDSPTYIQDPTSTTKLNIKLYSTDTTSTITNVIVRNNAGVVLGQLEDQTINLESTPTSLEISIDWSKVTQNDTLTVYAWNIDTCCGYYGSKYGKFANAPKTAIAETGSKLVGETVTNGYVTINGSNEVILFESGSYEPAIVLDEPAETLKKIFNEFISDKPEGSKAIYSYDDDSVNVEILDQKTNASIKKLAYYFTGLVKTFDDNTDSEKITKLTIRYADDVKCLPIEKDSELPFVCDCPSIIQKTANTYTINNVKATGNDVYGKVQLLTNDKSTVIDETSDIQITSTAQSITINITGTTKFGDEKNNLYLTFKSTGYCNFEIDSSKATPDGQLTFTTKVITEASPTINFSVSRINDDAKSRIYGHYEATIKDGDGTVIGKTNSLLFEPNENKSFALKITDFSKLQQDSVIVISYIEDTTITTLGGVEISDNVKTTLGCDITFLQGTPSVSQIEHEVQIKLDATNLTSDSIYGKFIAYKKGDTSKTAVTTSKDMCYSKGKIYDYVSLDVTEWSNLATNDTIVIDFVANTENRKINVGYGTICFEDVDFASLTPWIDEKIQPEIKIWPRISGISEPHTCKAYEYKIQLVDNNGYMEEYVITKDFTIESNPPEEPVCTITPRNFNKFTIGDSGLLRVNLVKNTDATIKSFSEDESGFIEIVDRDVPLTATESIFNRKIINKNYEAISGYIEFYDAKYGTTVNSELIELEEGASTDISVDLKNIFKNIPESEELEDRLVDINVTFVEGEPSPKTATFKLDDYTWVEGHGYLWNIHSDFGEHEIKQGDTEKLSFDATSINDTISGYVVLRNNNKDIAWKKVNFEAGVIQTIEFELTDSLWSQIQEGDTITIHFVTEVKTDAIIYDTGSYINRESTCTTEINYEGKGAYILNFDYNATKDLHGRLVVKTSNDEGDIILYDSEVDIISGSNTHHLLLTIPENKMKLVEWSADVEISFIEIN